MTIKSTPLLGKCMLALLQTFIILLYESTIQITPGSVWKTLVALTEVVDSRESFGLERALGKAYSLLITVHCNYTNTSLLLNYIVLQLVSMV